MAKNMIELAPSHAKEIADREWLNLCRVGANAVARVLFNEYARVVTLGNYNLYKKIEAGFQVRSILVYMSIHGHRSKSVIYDELFTQDELSVWLFLHFYENREKAIPKLRKFVKKTENANGIKKFNTAKNRMDKASKGLAQGRTKKEDYKSYRNYQKAYKKELGLFTRDENNSSRYWGTRRRLKRTGRTKPLPDINKELGDINSKDKRVRN